MADFFGASPAQIKKASELVVDTAQYVEGLRKGVQTTTQELTATGWLGTASAKFLQAMTKWDEQMMIVRRDLESIAQKMGDNSITYSAADQDVQSGMNRVDALINTGTR
ncbi:WXG100 family type VII secretion target [Planomonospora sp. ID91781]|uniref:ESAT-6-like protein n=1 Tax=Planomonospora sphaerica TaxID=161355 RepID=A0A161LL22_9ACTN|nr:MULTISPECIES: WXG100 family type VII secretion target [Planomonospora]MBG0825397.1 WXG100 family type VII secretion target [Planomonospora sp. ID91781]GAT67595.1 proteins of 100 residues with WXG [Planomonospora sphaerica]